MLYMIDYEGFKSTTILIVRRGDGDVAIGGDGQVTLDDTVVKSKAVKIRKVLDGRVLLGFAGAAADGLTLFEKFEGKLKEFPDNLPRAALELARDWRTDKVLRRLEALIVVADKKYSYLISGSGDVIEPDDGIIAIGSGAGYAKASARALLKFTDLPVEEIVRESLTIASDICIYTNDNIKIEKIGE